MTDDARRIHFVGLGKMGTELVGHVARCLPPSFRLSVHDQDESRVVDVVSRTGVVAAPHPAGLRPGDVICTSVPDGGAVAAVVAQLEHDGEASGLTVMDFSSIAPADAVSLAQRLAARDSLFFDAPVTGGVAGAHAGTLTTMIGGPTGLPADLRWIPESFSSRVVDIGSSGHAALMKSLSNMVGNISAIVTIEAILVARSAGVPEESMLEVLNNGPARTYYSEFRYPEYVQTGRFDAGMQLGLVIKDLAIAIDAASSLGLSLPVSTSGYQSWRAALERLGGASDTTRAIESVALDVAGRSWSEIRR